MGDAFLLSAASMRTVPVVIVDVIAAAWLFLVWRRAPAARRTDLAALPLALYFASLAALAFAQLMMSSTIDVRASFLWNHGGQSVSAALGVPALIAFSLRYLAQERRPAERVLVRVVVVVGVAIAAAFVVDALATQEVRYDFASTHARKLPADELPWQLLIFGWTFAGYTVALVVLARRAWRAKGEQRRRVLAFAGVVLAAVGAVFVNRAEVLEWVPQGVYATYVVWVTLAAILLFMGSTDEITSFRERTVALVLVAVLALVATVAQRAVDGVRDDARATRRALAPAVLAGVPVLGAAPVVGAVVGAAVDGAGDGAAAGAWGEHVRGGDPATARIVVRAEGGAVGFPYVDERRAVHAAGAPLAALLVASVLGVLLFMPALAQWSVLGPLAALTRAEEQSRAKSRFLAQMSHELKTPLHAILFHARALLEPRAPDDAAPDREARARTIERAAEHLRAMIENLLASGARDLRAIAPRPAPVAVQELAERVVAAHRPAADAKALALTVSFGDALAGGAHGMLDAGLVRQVLDNLVGNAIKYTDAGAVALAVALDGEGEHAALELTVTDTGRGIPMAMQERVFQPFFQHEASEGVGLGLSIVDGIVKALGGALALTSTEGQGTTVRVRLPWVPAAPAAAPDPDGAAPARALPRPTAQELEPLLALARVGDVVAAGAEARARKEAAAPEHRAFYERAVALAGAYQVRALRRLLEAPDEPAARETERGE